MTTRRAAHAPQVSAAPKDIAHVRAAMDAHDINDAVLTDDESDTIEVTPVRLDVTACDADEIATEEEGGEGACRAVAHRAREGMRRAHARLDLRGSSSADEARRSGTKEFWSEQPSPMERGQMKGKGDKQGQGQGQRQGQGVERAVTGTPRSGLDRTTDQN